MVQIKDPVCGQELEHKISAVATYKGKKYNFCCASCQWAFEKNPEQYVK